MKKLIIIPLLCITFFAKTQVVAIWFTGVLSSTAVISQWYYPDRNTNGFTFSYALDPGMLLKEYNLDSRFKIAYHYNRIEPNVTFEYFPAPFYYSGISTALDYMVINRKCGLLFGVETTHIWNKNSNKNLQAQSFGINSELRYILNDYISISVLHNIKTRPELANKLYVYSFYLSLNLKLKALKQIKHSQDDNRRINYPNSSRNCLPNGTYWNLHQNANKINANGG